MTINGLSEKRRSSELPCPLTGVYMVKNENRDDRYPNSLRGKFLLDVKSG
jgi:hypothetical protein